jgi:hypothetical protein
LAFAALVLTTAALLAALARLMLPALSGVLRLLARLVLSAALLLAGLLLAALMLLSALIRIVRHHVFLWKGEVHDTTVGFSTSSDAVEIERLDGRTRDLVHVHSDPDGWDWIINRQSKHWLTS